jgi:hypothetical protein
MMHKPIEAARIAGFSETSGASSKVEKRRKVQAYDSNFVGIVRPR